jgi:hypothetical protein
MSKVKVDDVAFSDIDKESKDIKKPTPVKELVVFGSLIFLLGSLFGVILH